MTQLGLEVVSGLLEIGFNLNSLFKLNPTQMLEAEIKLRGTPRFNFHTNSYNKINPNPNSNLNKVEPINLLTPIFSH